MIKTLSDYIIRVPFKNPTTNLVALSYTMDLFIWDGDYNAPPTTPVYSITKPNPLYTDGFDSLNLARIINDFIVFEFSNLTGGAGNQVWFRYDIRYSDTPLVVTTTFKDSAIKGYFFNINAQYRAIPEILTIGNDFKVGRKSKFVFAILAEFYDAGGVVLQPPPKEVIVTYFPSNQFLTSFDIDPTSLSSQLINNFIIDLSGVPDTEDYVNIAINGESVITLLLIDECRYNTVDIAFINAHGAVQIQTFFKERKDSFVVTKERYNSINGVVEYAVNSRSKFTVNSGFVDEDKNDIFRQMLLSEKCWEFTSAGGAIPLNIATKNFSYKTRTNDRLINYEIEFDYAFNDIYRG